MSGRRSSSAGAHRRWLNQTRGTALERLAAEYPDRFAVLVDRVRREEPETWDEQAQDIAS